MVKKILFLLTFLFITLDVNAWTLSQPYVNYEFANDPTFPQGAYGTKQTHYNTSFYVSPFLLGGVDYSDYVKSVYFTYYNTGFCANQDISVSGTLYGGGYGTTNGLFNDESVSTVVKNNSQALSCVFNNVNGQLMNYQCYGKGGGDFSIEFHLNSYHSPNQYLVGISENVSITCDASNLDVISNATANTNAIISNQNGNTQVIINNQNSNTSAIIGAVGGSTSDIINNQNSNTDKEIESQEVCKISIIDNKNIVTSGSMLNSSGEVVSTSGWGITDYLKFEGNVKKINTTGNAPSLCFYNNNKELISCFQNSNIPVGDVNVPANSVYLRASIAIDVNRPQYEINYCKNGNQALSDDLNTLNDTISSDTPPDTENQLNNLNNSMISDTPITDLITLPITLIRSYITGFNGSCSAYNFGNLLGTDIIFPCINLEQRLGSNLWTIIDSLTSIFLIYNIAMLFITAFEGFTSLRDDYESLYQPRHADTGYQPKHGGGN